MPEIGLFRFVRSKVWLRGVVREVREDEVRPGALDGDEHLEHRAELEPRADVLERILERVASCGGELRVGKPVRHVLRVGLDARADEVHPGRCARSRSRRRLTGG